MSRSHDLGPADPDAVVAPPAPSGTSPGKRTLTASQGVSTMGVARAVLRLLRESSGAGVDPDAEGAVAAAGGAGAALPGALQARFEESLGVDLSGVRVHTDAASERAAGAVGARAYAVGNDIHFAAGEYDPGSTGGQYLLAHEVAHTVQHAGGATSARQHKLEVSTPGDALEVDADRAADAMVAGRSADVIGAGNVEVLHRETDDERRIREAKAGFDLAVQQATPMFGNIALQQATIVQQTKEASLKQDPPPIEASILAGLVGAAIGAVAGPLGAAVAARVGAIAVQSSHRGSRRRRSRRRSRRAARRRRRPRPRRSRRRRPTRRRPRRTSTASS
jgi:hypothetical protein